jgi:hypothetical protein
MAAQSTQPVRNEMSRTFRDREMPRHTDGATPTTPSSLVAEMTTGTANYPLDHLPVTRTRVPPATTDAPQQGIAGVVAEVYPETITVQCSVGREQIEINLPTALFPSELQAYGQTIMLSLDYSGGYQRPVVQRRAPEPREVLPGEAELDAWVDAL